MSAYRVSLDEFMELYGDHPEFKHLWKTDRKSLQSDRSSKSGNNDDVDRAIRKMTRTQRYIRRLSFWKRQYDLQRKSSDASGQQETVVICKEQEPVDGHHGEDDVKKSNVMKKLMKQFGRVILRHFYFMNVAIENTGGLYVVKYSPTDGGMLHDLHLDYYYTSSYAATSSSLAY